MQVSHTIDKILERTSEELLNPDSNYVYRYCDGHKLAVAISEDQIKLESLETLTSVSERNDHAHDQAKMNSELESQSSC